jgi:uncharacterized protein (DUF1684 family)
MSKFFFLIIAITVVSCTSNTEKQISPNTNNTNYIDSVNTLRKEHDKELKTDPKTPLELEKVEAFVGLNYYAPDEKWNIHAPYTTIDTGKVFDLPTTTERVIPMIKDGIIHFQINGKKIHLYAYRYLDHPNEDLFVPFLDQTNGDITYGGGRYIEVKRPINDSVWVDFNMAYNPYCAYNHKYSCPIPPLENSLNIEVLAGEKVLYHY